MVKGTSIQIRLTKQQKERMILAMQNAGFKTLSSFVRNNILDHGLAESQMIRELHEKLIGGSRNG